MARAGSVCVAVLLAVCCAETILVAGATEWHVGDDKGWTFGVAGWENGKRIQPGDELGEIDARSSNIIYTFSLLYFVLQVCFHF